MILIRRVTQEDKPALEEFLQAAYKNRWKYKYPERWYWEYVDNPFLDGDGLPVFIAIDEQGKIVGQTCTLVEPLKLGEKMCRVGWGVDSFVLPEYRGKGIGSMLQKANDDYNEIFMSLDMAPTNRRIKQRLGSVPIEPVPIYYRLVTNPPEEILSALGKRLPERISWLKQWFPKVIRRTQAHYLGAAVKDALLSIKDRRRLSKPESYFQIETIPTFGEEFDKLWERVSPSFYAIVRRDAVFLNWKYVRQPFIEYSRFAIRHQGELRGYVIMRVGRPPEPKLGIISDLFVAPHDRAVIEQLLSHSVRFFKTAGVKDILTATSIYPYQISLGRLGFRKIGEASPMFHCRASEMDCSEALQPDRWFLGKSDHDWDQYPLAR